MTRKLADDLIAYYEGHINEIKRINFTDYFELLKYLISFKIEDRLCYCAIKIFGEDLIHDDWIKSKLKENNSYLWIYSTPEDTTDINEAIEALQKRLDILKTF